MSTTPRDLLQFASEEIGSDREVNRRAAASRAYYAAYHQCLLLSKQLPPGPSPPKNRGSHEKFLYNLKNNTHPDRTTKKRVRQLGESLKQLKTIRSRADYRLDRVFNKDLATLAHRQGELIVAKALELDQPL